MIGPRTRRSPDYSERGVSDAINYIIIFGVVLGAAAFIVGFGGQVVDDTRRNAEIQHAENAFAKLDSKTSASALGRTGTRSTISLGTQTSPEASTSITRSGTVKVISENISTGNKTELVNKSIGAVVYENNGEVIAYQGGGVFKKSPGDNESTFISPPEVRYRGDTLTLPLIVLGENSTLTNDADKLSVQQQDKTSLLTNQRRVEGTQITIQITSDYYRAWGDYFDNRVGDKTTVVYHDNNDTVSINLGLPKQAHPQYDGGLVSTGDILAENSTSVDGPVIAEGDIENVDGETSEFTQTGAKSIDTIVQSHVNEGRDSGTDLGVINESMVLDGGLYYADGIQYDSSVMFDPDNDGEEEANGLHNGTLELSAIDENVTLIVDGDINVGQTARIVSVADANQTVQIFTTGDVKLGTGSPEIKGNVPEKLQIYGTSETDLLISQNATFKATFYAPTDNPASGSADTVPGNGEGNGNGGGSGAYCQSYSYDACIGSNADVEGAIVTGTIRAHNDADITYREGLAGIESTISPVEVRPRLVYLHMSISEVDIKAQG